MQLQMWRMHDTFANDVSLCHAGYFYQAASKLAFQIRLRHADCTSKRAQAAHEKWAQLFSHPSQISIIAAMSSQDASVVAFSLTPAQSYSTKQWDNFRPLITQLYRDESKSLL